MNFIRNVLTIIFFVLLAGCSSAETVLETAPAQKKTAEPINTEISSPTAEPAITQQPTVTVKPSTSDGFTQEEKDYLSFTSPLYEDYSILMRKLLEFNDEFVDDNTVISDSEWVGGVEEVLRDMVDYSLEMATYSNPPILFAEINERYVSIHLETRKLEKNFLGSFENNNQSLIEKAQGNITAIKLFSIQIDMDMNRITRAEF
jgi:hypothetical protein